MDLLRHLRLFVTVAEELHFSRAADRLGMAQPPLSQAVQRLEKELGAELFDRAHRRIRLTAAGAVILDEARELLAREERLRVLARRAGDGALGTLRAGVPPDTTAAVLSALLAACAERSPGLSVDLQEVTTEEQVRLLASGGLDVGLVHQPVDATELRLGPEVPMDLGVVLPRTSPLAGLPEVALGELVEPRSRALSAGPRSRLVRPDSRRLPRRGLRARSAAARVELRVPAGPGDGGARNRLRPGAGGPQGAPRRLAPPGGPSPHPAAEWRVAHAAAPSTRPRAPSRNSRPTY